jgi:hypothetical protein
MLIYMILYMCIIGAANRHLGLLSVLGVLGHNILRAALRVGPTKNLPIPARELDCN